MITIENKQYNAGLYLRLSREKIEKNINNVVNTYKSEEFDTVERESGSITNQKSFLKRYCQEHNINVYDVYADDGVSGGNFDRPEFNRMLNDIENHKINMVIVKDLSRFGRAMDVTKYLDEYFPLHKIRFIAVADNIDTGIQETTNDNIAQMKAFFNEWFLRDASRKTKNGKKNKAKDGKVMTTYPTYRI